MGHNLYKVKVFQASFTLWAEKKNRVLPGVLEEEKFMGLKGSIRGDVAWRIKMRGKQFYRRPNADLQNYWALVIWKILFFQIDVNLGMYGFLEALRNTSGNENQGVDTEVGWYKFFSSRWFSTKSQGSLSIQGMPKRFNIGHYTIPTPIIPRRL